MSAALVERFLTRIQSVIDSSAANHQTYDFLSGCTLGTRFTGNVTSSQYHDAIAHREDVGQVVRNEDYRHAVFLAVLQVCSRGENLRR